MLSFYSGNYSTTEKQLLYAMITDNIKALHMLCNGNCKQCDKKYLCRDLYSFQTHLLDLVQSDERFMHFMEQLDKIPFISTL